MKLAIFGAGMIVKDFLTMISDVPNVHLKAILGVAADVPTMSELAQKYNIPKIYTNLDACLTDPEIDTVYIGLPNFLHYSYAKQSLYAGKNVIVEKPFVLTQDQGKELAQIAEDKDLIVVEAANNQYLNNFKQIKEDLPKLGQLKIIDCNYSQFSHRYDAFKKGRILPAFDPQKGGGALMDLNIYNIHFVTGLLGAPEKVHYYANVARGIDTSGMLILEYSGIKVVCTGAKDCAAPVRTTIEGENGNIQIMGPVNILEKFDETVSGKTKKIDQRIHQHRMFQEFVAFTKMIDTHDTEEAKKRMAHSLVVLGVVDAALKDAGIKLG
ncbi:Gfo/Idh/MocA family protein [Pediococcus siamensis]|uniref:Gfo/Idh/MocA family protein n=1 Tax=Pediococcus siamensis TaxID=381829 RepID=UPI0039A2A672